jgi:hypothetical protein
VRLRLGRLHKILMILMLNDDFATWMKNLNNYLACFTYGIKPGVFRIERLED